MLNILDTLPATEDMQAKKWNQDGPRAVMYCTTQNFVRFRQVGGVESAAILA